MLTVYSKDGCSQCQTVVKILEMRGITHEVKKLDADYTMEQLTEACSPAPAPRAFPVVMLDGSLVGGLRETQLAIASGKIA